VAGMGGRANRSSRAGEQWRRGGGIRPRSEKETGKERKIKPFFHNQWHWVIFPSKAMKSRE
jgi:hypothetical protein